MINDEYIIKHFFGKTGKINRFAVQRITDEELKYLQNRYNDSDSLNETLIRIKYNINEHPHCKTCGKRLNFYYSRKKQRCQEFCSSKCAGRNEEIKNKIAKTCLERYGATNPGGSKEIQEKIKNTMRLHYGVEHAFQSEEVKNKIIESHKRNLGVNWPMQSKEVQEKSKQTCLKKYGCEYTGQAEIKKQHSKETFLKHYGVDHNWKNKDCFQKTIENRFKNRQYTNDITSSKQEDICYNLLKEKFKNVIRQKRDKIKYPYNCDFYVKDIDMWIEFNGFMTHGGHPFDSTNECDIERLQYLTEKNLNHKNPDHNLYYASIITWTISDPIKRNTAKNNNLNYLEVFSVDELKTWLKEYEEEN